MSSDDETRPSGQDLTTYHSIAETYLEPVEKPEWMKPHHHHWRRPRAK